MLNASIAVIARISSFLLFDFVLGGWWWWWWWMFLAIVTAVLLALMQECRYVFYLVNILKKRIKCA